MRHLFCGGILAFALAGGSLASAAPIIFSGIDAGANSTNSRPSSNAAAASFDTAAGTLGAISLITFEGVTTGSFGSLMVAPGVTLTSSTSSIRNAPAGSPDKRYGYNTTIGGSQFVLLSGRSLNFTFAIPVNAFGAYISGVQLAGETITFNDGSSRSLTITNPDSGVQFLGFTDKTKLISSITINSITDIIGIDDVRYTTSVSAISEPASIALLGASLLGFGYLRRAVRLCQRSCPSAVVPSQMWWK